MKRKAILLGLVLLAVLGGAPAPPGDLGETELLKVQMMGQRIQLLDKDYKIAQYDIQHLQEKMTAMQTQFASESAEMNKYIDELYKSHKVEKTAFNLDTATGKFVPVMAPPAAQTPGRQPQVKPPPTP